MQRPSKKLVEGDPFAWSMVIGILAMIGLAFAVSALCRRPRKKPGAVDPAEIVKQFEKQRSLFFACAWTIVPTELILGGILAVSVDEIVGLIVILASLFTVFLIGFVNGRCPACGAMIEDRHWKPEACHKCGVPLREANPPGQEAC